MLKILLSIVVISFIITPGYSQETTSETESTVQELSDFHDIIYPIWHTAYPANDYAALRSFSSDVESGASKIYTAVLPGILRDKQEEWNSGIEKLKLSVNNYSASAAGTDDKAMLDAAETLHSSFEMLIRIIRPPLAEVDEFHKVLYVIYHKYLPVNDVAGIYSVIDDLIIKAELLKNASLPERHKHKSSQFRSLGEELYNSVVTLKETLSSDDQVLVSNTVEVMHTNYQSIEQLFE